MIFAFDGQQLPYTPGEFEAKFDHGVTCSQDSIIVIDDNFSDENRFVRILTNGDDLDFHLGFFDHVSFPKKVRTQLMISDTYSMWYNIEINVE